MGVYGPHGHSSLNTVTSLWAPQNAGKFCSGAGAPPGVLGSASFQTREEWILQLGALDVPKRPGKAEGRTEKLSCCEDEQFLAEAAGATRAGPPDPEVSQSPVPPYSSARNEPVTESIPKFSACLT
jgi:hypothetical protein